MNIIEVIIGVKASMVSETYLISKNIHIKNLIKTGLLFLVLFAVFFLYQKRVVSDNYIIIYVVNTLVLIIFILSVFRIKFGLYLFIFLIPLLNSLTTILGIKTVQIILFLFFSLVLGFIVNNVKNIVNQGVDKAEGKLVFDSEITKPVLIFIIIFTISSLVVIYRYANYFPFITNRYYDLVVNVNGIRSTGSIFWTIRFFFNYIIGFALLFIIFNVLDEVKDIVKAIIVLISSSIISSIVGFYQYFYNPFFGNIRYWVNINRINATFTDPNSLGAFTLLVFPVFVTFIIFFKKWYVKLIFIIVFIPFLISMFFSGSRSAFLGLFVSLFIFAILGIWKGIKKFKEKLKCYSLSKKVLAIVPIVLLCVFLLYFVVNFFYKEFSKPPLNNDIRIAVDSPSSEEILSGNVKISGWALNKSYTEETGIKRIEIYLEGLDSDGKLIGEANYGVSRPDVAEYFENEYYTNSGYELIFNTKELPEGTKTLYICAYAPDDSYFYKTHKINVETESKSRFTLTDNVLIKRISSTINNTIRTLRGGEGVFQAISSGRNLLWRQAINMFLDYPISGAGLGAYIIELPNYYVKSGVNSNLVDYTGNYYLQILSELGIAGLVVVLFIFFVIIKKVFIYFKGGEFINGLNGSNWLVVGFFTSFISMLIAQFFGPHTNFTEIQFTFWLIIGLMLTYIKVKENSESISIERDYSKILNNEIQEDNILKNKSGSGKENQGQLINKVKTASKKIKALNIGSKVKFDLVQKISLVVIILIFTVSFFVSSFSNLSINVKQNLYGWENKYGFYEEEISEDKKFRWTNVDASESIEKKGSSMVIPLRAGNPDIYKRAVFARIYIDNFLVKVIRLKDDNWHDIELNLPNIKREKITLTIAVSRSWIPKEWGISDDSRELGIAIGEIKFVR